MPNNQCLCFSALLYSCSFTWEQNPNTSFLSFAVSTSALTTKWNQKSSSENLSDSKWKLLFWIQTRISYFNDDVKKFYFEILQISIFLRLHWESAVQSENFTDLMCLFCHSVNYSSKKRFNLYRFVVAAYCFILICLQYKNGHTTQATHMHKLFQKFLYFQDDF